MSRPPARMITWIAGGIILSAAAAYLAARIGARTHDHPSPHHRRPSDSAKKQDLHEWMHGQLDIPSERWTQLEPFEKAFDAQSSQLLQEIKSSGEDLAAAIRLGDRATPAIKNALDRINTAQAKLQEITLDHFFVMKEHLDPEQADRLLQWTHDSITRQHHD